MENSSGNWSVPINGDFHNIRNSVATIYVFLLMLGVLGNLWVILTILSIRCASVAPFRRQYERWSSVPGVDTALLSRRQRRRQEQGNNHVLSYVLALSIVDLCALSVLPFTIANTLVQGWNFGVIFCKVYWLVESVNKVTSISLLTVVSIDRFLKVCYPAHFISLRTSTAVRGIVLGCFTFSIILLSPLLIYTDVIVYNNSRTSICVEQMPPLVARTFICYIFVFGYALPATLIAVSYSCLFATIRRQANSETLRSHIDVGRVAWTVGLSFSFYIVCWTPYWILILLTNAIKHRGFEFVIAWTFVHTLPMLNSAGNWIFYVNSITLRNVYRPPFRVF